MNFLVNLFVKALPTLLNWAWGKLSPLFRLMQANKELLSRQEGRMTQAELCEFLRHELLMKMSNPLTPPEEIAALKEQLRVESRKLINM